MEDNFSKPSLFFSRFKSRKFIILTSSVVILLVVIVIALGFYFSRKQVGSGRNFDFNFDRTSTPAMKLVAGEHLDNRGCKGSGTVMFGNSPMNLKDVGIVLPLGGMVGAHVTPIDHMYFSPIVFNSPRDTYEVRAIGDGVVTSISRRTHQVTDKNNGALKPEEYQLKFWHTCDFSSYFDLITSLAPKLKAEFDAHVQQGDYARVQIQVKEGELIGRIGGQTLDFSVFDYTKQLPGFIVPEHYLAESWKIHVVNAFDYFKEPVRSQLLSLNPRQVEPRSGRIDYDIDGKLVGTWFKLGNNGFGSTGGQYPLPWRAHLSFVYDSIDPSALVISIGDYGGETAQFGVKGNAPDPATIDVSSVSHKYELTQLGYYTTTNGQMWDRIHVYTDIKARSQPNVQGVVLVQMLENRKIKFEAFPGKTAEQVSGFDNNAIMYER